MIDGKTFNQGLQKFMKAEVTKNARMQVQLPNGEFYDIVGIKLLENKIIGVTCHNSRSLAKIAIGNKADYVAFGSFSKSELKPKAKKAELNILKWAKKNIKKPIVVIGGINNRNYKKLIHSGAKYIALSSFIWDNPKLKPEQAISKFK